MPSHLHPAAAVGIEVGGHRVGAVGELHPEVCGHFGLEVSVAVLELDLSALLELPARDARFREVSRQPAVRRDLAVVLDGSLAAGDVLDAVRKTAGGDCIAAEIFDRYEGRGIPAGRVSLAFRLTFQRTDRTLTDAEVTRAIDRVVKMLSHRFDGELR